MAYKFFPQGGRQLLTGGLNSKYGPNIIEADESPDLLNVVFDSGCVSTRQGVQVVNTTTAGSFACDGIYSYRNNAGAESMVVFFGGLGYSLSGTTLYTIPSAQSVFTAGVRVASEQAENYIFFSNGNASPYKYNGAFTRHGVPAPTQTLTVASAATVGALTASGNYLYGYTYVNSNLVEGNLSPVGATFIISTTSGQNVITNFGTAAVSYGVNTIYLNRTKANTTTPFYRVATITTASSTYTDNIADAALSILAPTDNGVPPNYTSICYAQGRLFCNDTANPNRVYYSNAANPYTFPALSFVRVGDNTSDTVQGVYYYNNSIVITCERSVWFLYLTDDTPGNWVGPIRSNSAYGSKSPYGVFGYNNKLMFPAMYNQQFVGFAALSGNVLDTSRSFLTVSSAGSDLKTNNQQPDMYSVQTSFIRNVSATVYKKKAWVTLTYGSGGLVNNRVYQMDFSMNTLQLPGEQAKEAVWIPFSGFSAAQFCVYQGSLYFGDANATGKVYQAESGIYNDAGSAINSYIKTKEFVGLEDEQGSDTNLYKDFRYANILADTQGTYYMNVTWYIDSDKGAGMTQQLYLDPGGSRWGTMIYGVDPWGGGVSQIEPRIYLGGARGKRIQFKFSNQNTINQRFSVYGLNFLYNLVGYR